MAEPQVLARFDERVVDGELVVRLHPDLVAEVAGEGDAPDQGRREPDLHRPDGHEPERLVAHVRDRHPGQQLARLRPRDAQSHQLGPEAAQAHPVVGQVLPEPAHVIRLRGTGPEDQEPLGAELREREVTDQRAPGIEHRREHHASLAGDAVGEQLPEPQLRAGAGDLVLAEARGLGDADALAHRAALLADRAVRIGTAEGQRLDRLGALRRIPQRLLQPERGGEHRPLRLQAIVDGSAAQRPPRRTFLVGERHQETGRVGLAGHRPGVRGPRVVAEPGDVHRPGVHARIAVDHPAREREADPAPLAEARQHAARGPVVPHLRHRSD